MARAETAEAKNKQLELALLERYQDIKSRTTGWMFSKGSSKMRLASSVTRRRSECDLVSYLGLSIDA